MNAELIAVIIALIFGLISVWLMLVQQRIQIKQESRDEYRLLVEAIKNLNLRMDKLDDRFDKLDAKIDKVNTDLSAKIDKVNSDLSAKIDKVNTDLSAKIDKVNSDLSARVDALNARLDTVITTIFRKDIA